jgi:hypothetical protein
MKKPQNPVVPAFHIPDTQRESGANIKKQPFYRFSE